MASETTTGNAGSKDARGRGGLVSNWRLLVTGMFAIGLTIFWGQLLSGTVKAQVVSGESMAPTLASGDRLLVRAVKEGDLELGAVVVVSAPEGWGSDLIKRIVAVAGDTVEIRLGKFYVNGELSPYQGSTGATMRERLWPRVVPPGHFFVMGDNRPISLDSQEFGPVHRDAIKAVTMWRYFPFMKAGRIE